MTLDKEVKATCLLFEEVFSEKLMGGQSMVGGEVKLNLKKGARPIYNTNPRAYPRYLVEPAKKFVKSLVENNIIDPVSVPTEWCSSGFMVKKPGEGKRVRLVNNLRSLNTNIIHAHHPFPTSNRSRRPSNLTQRIS